MNRILISIFALALAAVPGRSAVFHFKNGDQLTGEWERVQQNALVLKTDTIGEVQIPLDKLAGFTSPDSAVVLLTDGKQVEGKLALQSSGDWQVETAAGSQEVAAKSVVIIFPAKTYTEHGYAQKPRIWQKWSGKGALGYSQVRGDQNARTLTVDFNATRRMPVLPQLKERSRSNFSFNMIFANTEDSKGVRVSANSYSGALRQDFKISDKNFWFLLAQADHSQPQSLNLRQTYGGGFGRDLLRRSSLELQALGGVTYVNEHFVGQVIRKNAEGLLGEKFGWKMTPWLGLDHSLTFYPNLSDGGKYRFDTSTSLAAQINKRLSFNTTYADHYLSNPLPNHRKNEVIITAGVGATF